MGDRQRWAWGAALGLWTLAVASGFTVLWRYESARGAEATAPLAWPGGTKIARAAGRATLIMFIHPRCPCSRASVVEFGRTLARVRGLVAPVVVFIRPQGLAEGWERSELWRLAEGVPDVRLVADPDGHEADLFAAATSGASRLYDVRGRLVFSGGLTSVRGHEGNSFGQERIVARLTGGPVDRDDSPVFGCPLEDDARTEGEP